MVRHCPCSAETQVRQGLGLITILLLLCGAIWHFGGDEVAQRRSGSRALEAVTVVIVANTQQHAGSQLQMQPLNNSVIFNLLPPPPSLPVTALRTNWRQKHEVGTDSPSQPLPTGFPPAKSMSTGESKSTATVAVPSYIDDGSDESHAVAGTFLCRPNRSAPLVPTRNRRGKVRMKRYNQTCAAREPPFTAGILRNATFIWRAPTPATAAAWRRPIADGADGLNEKQEGDGLTPNRGGESIAPVLLAACFSGQIRRLGSVGPHLLNNIVRPNKAHAFVATWSYTDDGGTTAEEMMYTVDMLRSHFGASLQAVRVQQFHPLMAAPFQKGTAFMFYLVEACARLVVDTVAKTRIPYHFMGRFRLDLMALSPLRIVMRLRLDAADRTVSSSSDDKENVVSSRLQNRSAVVGSTMVGVPWVLNVGGRTASIPAAAAIVVHHYTKACVNDWAAIGPFDAMRAYSFTYSWLRMLARENGRNSAWQCFAEVCFQRFLSAHNFSWVVADLAIQLGTPNFHANIGDSSFHGRCRYV